MRKLTAQLRERDVRIASLEQAIASLRQGADDIELSGDSQVDMEDVLGKCNEDPQLPQKIEQHDSTGTLHLFWKEQVITCMHILTIFANDHFLSVFNVSTDGAHGRPRSRYRETHPMESHSSTIHASPVGTSR